jgi:hypothetical protein
MANYSALSPYYSTDQSKGYLDIITWRSFPMETDDILFTVTPGYKNRPDLLSFDLYQNVGYWWVFAARNPSVIQDPIFDMVPGIKIYLPKLSSLNENLGS